MDLLLNTMTAHVPARSHQKKHKFDPAPLARNARADMGGFDPIRNSEAWAIIHRIAELGGSIQILGGEKWLIWTTPSRSDQVEVKGLSKLKKYERAFRTAKGL